MRIPKSAPSSQPVSSPSPSSLSSSSLTARAIKFIRSPLGILLIVYLVLGSAYSIVTPLFEASDELWHYPTVKTIADHGLQLPVQNPTVQTDWRQEGSQPPLYYMMSAVLTSWIDTSDLDKVRHVNPHSDIGMVVPDGNANMMIHDPAIESFPWKGAVLGAHLARFLSVLLGAVTVAMTYQLTIELFPGLPLLALAAAAFTAFNPMFLFISGSVNNDNLSNALGSVVLVLIIRLLKRTSAPSLPTLALIGVMTGAGLLAKLNIGFLIPFIALSLALIAYRLRDWRPFVIGGLVTGSLTILIAGWWYLRNAQLYGDPTGLNVFLQIVGRRNVYPNLAQLWSERQPFMMSYWGMFGGVNVPMPDIVYVIFTLLAFVSAIGLVIGLILWLRERFQHDKKVSLDWPLLLGRIVTIIWIVVLFVGLIRWTSETWASQGRLMFAAIAPLNMWMAVGLWSFKPVQRLLLQLSVAWFFFAALVIGLASNFLPYHVEYNTLYRTLIGQYTSPTSAPSSSKHSVSFREIGSSSPALVMRYSPLQTSVIVGQYLIIPAIDFIVKNKMGHNWSAFIHLENADGLIVAQRDVYLRQGLAITSLMQPGQAWTNDFAVRIPDFAYAPQRLKVVIGFYQLGTSERLIPAADQSASQQGPQLTDDNRVLLGTVDLLPRSSTLVDVPNPMNVNFGGEAELVGYNVSDLSLFPGKQVTVTLYWRVIKPMKTDYNVFVQILEPGTTRVFGAHDGQPAAWTRPTSTWKPGEIIKDEHTFKVSDDAPPGIWQIQAGMYHLVQAAKNSPPGSQAVRLRVITPDGGDGENVILLTRIRMTLAPEPF